jgi:hypothetical protein
LIVIFLALIFFSSFGMMGFGYSGGHMMNWFYPGFSFMWIFGWLFMILIIIVLVLLIIWLMKQLQHKGGKR